MSANAGESDLAARRAGALTEIQRGGYALRPNRSSRHSAATIVNQKTGNLKLVQKLLGHSNLSTTADVYTHTSADADRSAALALEQAIFGDLFQVVPRLGAWNKNAAAN
jgi:integrase